MEQAISQNNDRFSWQRMMMVARYYGNPMRRMIMIYSAILVTLYLLALLSSFWSIEFLLTSVASTALEFMCFFASFVFVLKNDSAVITQLPARGQEKAALIIGWSILFIPLLLIAEWTLCTGIASIFTENADVTRSIMAISDEMYPSKWFLLMNNLSNLIPMVTVLYVVMTVKHNRIAMGIGAAVVSLVALGIIGGVVGVVSALTDNTIHDIAAGVMPSEQSVTDTVQGVVRELVIVLGSISIVYTVIGLILTWRRIVNRQV